MLVNKRHTITSIDETAPFNEIAELVFHVEVNREERNFNSDGNVRLLMMDSDNGRKVRLFGVDIINEIPVHEEEAVSTDSQLPGPAPYRMRSWIMRKLLVWSRQRMRRRIMRKLLVWSCQGMRRRIMRKLLVWSRQRMRSRIMRKLLYYHVRPLRRSWDQGQMKIDLQLIIMNLVKPWLVTSKQSVMPICNWKDNLALPW
uniref:uncharacterized protein LOC122592063 n=1 Tax=Erigeron canadensis TaxID=72917 RepID=UPI001CB94F68|nr:uncharacterized protein LOC122592063 [Erigeron canadensis]